MAKGDEPSRDATVLDAPTLVSPKEPGPEVTTLAPMPVFDDEPGKIGAIVPPAGEFDLEWPTDADLGKAVVMPKVDASEGREDTAKIPAEVVTAARKAAGVPEPRSRSTTDPLDGPLETSSGTGATDPNFVAPPPALFKKPEPSVPGTPADLPLHSTKPPPMITEALPRPRRVAIEKQSAPRVSSEDETLDRAPTPPLGLKVQVPLGAVTITRSKIDPQLLPERVPAPVIPKEPAPLALPKAEPVVPGSAPLSALPSPLSPLLLGPVAPTTSPRRADGRFRLRLGQRRPGAAPLITPLEGGVTALVILAVGLLISLSPAPETKTLPRLGQAAWVPPPQAKAPPPPPPLSAPDPLPPMSMPPDLTDEQREAKLRLLEAEYWRAFPRPTESPGPM